MRLKPSVAADAPGARGVTVRGSTSIDISVPRVDVGRRARSEAITRSSSASDRKVGEPPPKCSCDTGWAAPSSARTQVDLELQRVQVFGGPLVVLGDDLVAGAVVAHRFAERDVHVQRQRRGAARHARLARAAPAPARRYRRRRRPRRSGRRWGRRCSAAPARRSGAAAPRTALARSAWASTLASLMRQHVCPSAGVPTLIKLKAGCA